MADNLNLADFYFKKYQNMSAIEEKKKKRPVKKFKREDQRKICKY